MAKANPDPAALSLAALLVWQDRVRLLLLEIEEALRAQKARTTPTTIGGGPISDEAWALRLASARFQRRMLPPTKRVDIDLARRAHEVARGTTRERRATSRAGARRAVRAGPDDPSDPSDDDELGHTPLQRALLHLRAALAVARQGGPRTVATFIEIATLAFARALTGERSQ